MEDIYKKFKNCFMRYAGKVLSSEFYAEDVVQDVFIGLFQQTNYFVSEAAALNIFMQQYIIVVLIWYAIGR